MVCFYFTLQKYSEYGILARCFSYFAVGIFLFRKAENMFYSIKTGKTNTESIALSGKNCTFDMRIKLNISNDFFSIINTIMLQLETARL